jgi:serine/threonine protein kinase
MPETKLFIHAKQSQDVELPGVAALPDAKIPIRMGSGAITSLISKGGMAIIYEIWNAELEVKRAIKLLYPDHTKESEERFQTEIKITAKLHHPNIVEIYAVGKWNELPYIEMERIDGLTLEKLIADSGGLPVEAATAIAIMTGRALNYAHNQDYRIYGKEYHGIIHRDLKPGNIMVTNTGIVKLMDFGIAKPMSASTRTMEGVVMGTMQYLAPEQLDGKAVDTRADIYSLGAVLYEMLTGARAFPEQNLGKLVTDKLNNNYIPLDGFSRKIPPALCSLVHKCLRYEKEKRIQTALEFLKGLGNIHKSLSDKSPEQILQRYMNNAHQSKTLISIRKHNRFPAIKWLYKAVLLIAATGAVFMIAPIFVRNNSKRPHVEIARENETLKKTPERFMAPKNKPTMEKQSVSKAPEEPAMKDVFKPIAQSAFSSSVIDNKIIAPRTSATDTKKKKHDQPVIAGAKPLLPPSKPLETLAQKITVLPEVNETRPLPVAPENPALYLEKMKQRYKTTDLMVIFTGEVDAGHYREALAVSEKFDKSDADTKKAKIYKLRAFKVLGDTNETIRLLLSGDIYDGEYYLEKARYFFERRDFQKAQELIKKASVSPCGFLDSKVFRPKLLFAAALCAGALYDLQANEENRKKATAAWYEVKTLFKTSPHHAFSTKADSEISRLNKTN